MARTEHFKKALPSDPPFAKRDLNPATYVWNAMVINSFASQPSQQQSQFSFFSNIQHHSYGK